MPGAIYLPIRAFGDFTISAAIIKKNHTEKVPVLLPEYMTGLFNALDCNNFFEIADVLKLGHYSKLFQLKKIRNFQDLYSVYEDVRIIKSNINRNCSYLLDYKDARSRLFGSNLGYPGLGENIYTSKREFFSKYFKISGELPVIVNEKKEIKNVMLFPGSRLLSKALNDDLVVAISNELKSHGYTVKTMYHESEKTLLKDVGFFKSFSELRSLVVNADFIVSADSLPIHVSYYFDRLHFVICNNQQNSKWETPFIRYHHSSAVYTNSNVEVVKKILSFISKIKCQLPISSNYIKLKEKSLK